MEKKEITRVPVHTLREKAPRALMVLERHKADPTIALFGPTLGPVTTKFIATYDETHSFRMTRPDRTVAQAKAVRYVWKRTEVWLAFLERDLSAFDSREYASVQASAVEVIAAGERLLTFVSKLNPETLPYAQQLIADLTEALRVAQDDWVDARGGLNELQARQADTRGHALAFERELDAFRRALKVILGESNSDYRSLLVPRRSRSRFDVVEEVADAAATQPLVLLNGSGAPSEEARH